jgi:hypothetical protein
VRNYLTLRSEFYLSASSLKPAHFDQILAETVALAKFESKISGLSAEDDETRAKLQLEF